MEPYSMELERLDTAIRAVWWLASHAKWDLLEDLGVYVPTFQAGFARASQEMSRPWHDSQVFRFLRLCPMALPAALELTRRYLSLYGLERQAFYLALNGVLRRRA